MIGHNKQLSYRHIAIPVKLCDEKAKMPTQADGDVGFDVYCVEDVALLPGATRRVKTGLVQAEGIEPIILDNKIIAIPYMKLETRSGMASLGVFVEGGVIDPRFRGEIEVVLHNSTEQAYTCLVGSKIAQLVVYLTLANSGPFHKVVFHHADEVKPTDRGEKGFGSTGD